jgi:C1A family cysteine protease
MGTGAIGALLFLLVVAQGFAQEALPSHYDWREELSDGLPPIKNQGNCGSSYIFPATAALETAILIKEGVMVSLSDQEILSCDSSNHGCGGGINSLPYLVKHGIALESSFPYAGKDLKCPQGLPVFRRADGWANVENEPGTDHPSQDAIKRAIRTYGAVISLVGISASLGSYSGGIYSTCDGTHANSMVNLVGWDDNGGYWIARNSWGTSWGEKGYFRIKYGCNHIGSEVSYVIYNGDSSHL